MKRPNPDFYTSDGRLNPDKALGFVHERLKAMSPEEFVTILNTPVKFKGMNETEQTSSQPALSPKKKLKTTPPASDLSKSESSARRSTAGGLAKPDSSGKSASAAAKVVKSPTAKVGRRGSNKGSRKASS